MVLPIPLLWYVDPQAGQADAVAFAAEFEAVNGPDGSAPGSSLSENLELTPTRSYVAAACSVDTLEL